MSRKTPPVFEERQNPVQARTYIALGVPPCVLLGLTVWQVVLGHPWGKQPMSNAGLIGWTIFICLVYLRLVTVRLTTRVQGGKIVVAMRGLWRSRTIKIADVKSVKPVTYDPVSDFGGYGIRSGRSGKAYIALGNEGVRLELASGPSILVGSQKPQQLADAIRSTLSK